MDFVIYGTIFTPAQHQQKTENLLAYRKEEKKEKKNREIKREEKKGFAYDVLVF